MQFQQGATVVTAEGEKVGKVRQLVVDPAGRQITHLVVTAGILFPKDALVPLPAIENTPSDDVVELSPGVDINAFEVFAADRFSVSPAPAAERFGRPGFVLYPTPPMASEAPVSGLAPEVSARRDLARAATTAAIESGTSVVSLDGRRVGRVEEIYTRDRGAIDALIVKRGFLWFADRVRIPIGWIREVDHDQVRLQLTKAQVLAGGDTDGSNAEMSIAQRPPGR